MAALKEWAEIWLLRSPKTGLRSVGIQKLMSFRVMNRPEDQRKTGEEGWLLLEDFSLE